MNLSFNRMRSAITKVLLKMVMLSNMIGAIAFGQNTLTLLSRVLPDVPQSQKYEVSIEVSGGKPPYSFRIKSGSLPLGLVLSASGAISGIVAPPGVQPIAGPPSNTGVFAFSLAVSDSTGISAQADFTLNVLQTNSLWLAEQEFPIALAKKPYSHLIKPTGGLAPYSFRILSGQLPLGITLDSVGRLEGMTQSPSLTTIVLRIQDSTGKVVDRQCSLRVNNPNVTLDLSSIVPGVAGLPYSVLLTAAGGVPPYSFKLSYGFFPDSLTLLPEGQIIGTPKTVGIFDIGISVSDSQGNSVEARSKLVIQEQSSKLSIDSAYLAQAWRGIPYSFTLKAVGGTPPYKFQLVSGALPVGLNMLDNGLIAGIPLNSIESIFVVQVLDSVNNMARLEMRLQAAETPAQAGLRILTQLLPPSVLGKPYSINLTAESGQVPYEWTLVSGSLPQGLILSRGGSILGTPSTTGSSAFSVQVVDRNGSKGLADLKLTVTSVQPRITTGTLPNGQIDAAYSAQISTEGGQAPYRYILTDGSLPEGVKLSATGILSGRPTTSGVNKFIVRSEDSLGAVALASLSLIVNSNSLSIVFPYVTKAIVGEAYMLKISAKGGQPPYSFAMLDQSLLPGLTLSSGGALEGVPTSMGSFRISIGITDAKGNRAQGFMPLTVDAREIMANARVLPIAIKGVAYSIRIVEVDRSSQINFILATGNLPSGLTLSSNGLISGVPNTSGKAEFALRSRDSNGAEKVLPFELVISESLLSLVPIGLLNGNRNAPFLQQMDATGGNPPYQFVVSSGRLPSGIDFDVNGKLYGRATEGGSFEFEVTVQDAKGQKAKMVARLNILDTNKPPTILDTKPPAGKVLLPYEFSFGTKDGQSQVAWQIVNGAIPRGLVLDSKTGVVSGVPLKAGEYSFTIRGTNQSEMYQEAIRIIKIEAVKNLGEALVGSYFRVQCLLSESSIRIVKTEMGVPSDGMIPLGLTVSQDGFISGYPSTPGEFVFSMKGYDSSGNSYEDSFGLKVIKSISSNFQISTSALPNASVGVPFNFVLKTTGGRAPVKWEIVNGKLPQGLLLVDGSEKISGKPLESGLKYFVARAIDAEGVTATAALSITTLLTAEISIKGIASAASYAAEGIAPGEMFVMFGSGLGSSSMSVNQAIGAKMSSELSGTRVLIDGVAVPIIYTSAQQVSAMAPFSIRPGSLVMVAAEYEGIRSMEVPVRVLSSQPALFTLDGSGKGQGAILNQNGTLNLENNPAPKGSTIVCFGTGAGGTVPSNVDGRIADTVSAISLPVVVSIDGSPADVLYAGNAPSLIEGIVQFNVRVPSKVRSGLLPVIVSVGNNSSLAAVSVWVQ